MNMKGFLIASGLAVFCLFAYTQVPHSFNYQAVARYVSGDIIQNQDISVRIGILQGITNDTLVYSETHSTATNQYGLFNLEVGKGIPEIGSFSSLDWSSGPYFIQIEMDEAGGTNYLLFDTAQIVSVPYALFSGSTGDTTRWQKSDTNLYYNRGNIGIGTTQPGEKMHIMGNIKVSGSLQLGTTAGIAIGDSCTSAQTGMIIFNGTNFCTCDGTTWKQVD